MVEKRRKKFNSTHFRSDSPVAVILFGGEAVKATTAYFDSAEEPNESSLRANLEKWKVCF